jgi:enterochelin esterase-like enzyme
MKKLLILSLLLTTVSLSQGQQFQEFLTRVNSAPDSLKPAIVDSFMGTVTQFPYIEQDIFAHFIYRGNANRVNVPGDANSWNSNADPMTRVEGTNLWYSKQTFESDARLDYKFVLNGSTWILDPLNPYQVSGGYGPNSELRMPQYVPAPEIEYRPSIPHGALWDTTFFSPQLGNSRRIRIYTPPGYGISDEHYPMMLFHDGLEYISLANADRVLDYLIWQGRIKPIVGVFVPPVNRTPEYAGNLKDEFSTFIVDEIIPWLDAKYRTIPDPAFRATLGASNGGNISLWLGLHHSDVFGNIAAQSSNVQESISNGFQTGPMLDLTFYLDIGTYDIQVLVPLVRNLRQILDEKGYRLEYHEYHEGHSWGNWRAHIDDALKLFFPANFTFVKGDVNRDGAIDIKDVLLIIGIILGTEQPMGEQVWAADCNGPLNDCDGDGSINVLDVVKIVRLALELEICQ